MISDSRSSRKSLLWRASVGCAAIMVVVSALYVVFGKSADHDRALELFKKELETGVPLEEALQHLMLDTPKQPVLGEHPWRYEVVWEVNRRTTRLAATAQWEAAERAVAAGTQTFYDARLLKLRASLQAAQQRWGEAFSWQLRAIAAIPITARLTDEPGVRAISNEEYLRLLVKYARGTKDARRLVAAAGAFLCVSPLGYLDMKDMTEDQMWRHIQNEVLKGMPELSKDEKTALRAILPLAAR